MRQAGSLVYSGDQYQAESHISRTKKSALVFYRHYKHSLRKIKKDESEDCESRRLYVGKHVQYDCYFMKELYSFMQECGNSCY